MKTHHIVRSGTYKREVGLSGRLILAFGGSLLAAAPVMAASVSVLTAPIERLPQSWGGARLAAPVTEQSPARPATPVSPPVAPPPAPALTALDRALAGLDAQAAALDQAEARRQSPPPSANDQVGALVVQARSTRPSEQTVGTCVTGPAWWKVTSATATLWIMATPDRLPMSTPFDDTCLRKRLAAARVVILPASARQGAASDPFGRGDTPLRPAEAALDQRLPPALWAQLSRRIDNNLVRAAADREWAREAFVDNLPPGIAQQLIPKDNGTGPSLRQSLGADWLGYTFWRYQPRTTLQIIRDTPNLFAPTILVAQRLALTFDLPGRTGNPAADRAARLAGEANMLVARTENSAAQFADLTYLSNPAEADQQACLKGVLDELDAGHAGLGVQSRVDAWARGDIENGLKRMNPISACSFGDLSVRFWSTIVAQEMELLNRALNEQGIAVAVVEYDPLFMRGGVMERLKAAGYRVETPEDLR
ncbi:MAG: TraB/GumN family protein [Caulobacteraceae bacterium]|nr:TraB/GumN family protein [Caulobacteraceae bacterium]